VTLTQDGRLNFWPIDSDEPVATTPGVAWPVSFTHDGSRVLAVDPATNTVQVLDPSTGQPVLNPLAGHTDVVNSVSTGEDGTLVVTGSQDGTARVWDGRTGQPLAVLEGSGAPVWAVAVRRDSGAVAAGYADGTVRVWQWPDPGQPRVVDGQEHGGAIVDFDAAGNVLAFGDKSPRVFDSDTGELRHELQGHRSWVLDARFSGDGQRLVTTSSDGTARVWDTASGQPVVVLRGHEDSTYIRAATDPTGSVVATVSGTSVRLFRIPEQRVLPAGQGDWILDLAVLPGEEQIAAGGEDGHVRVWDVAGTRVVADLTGPLTSVQGVDVDPSGRYVAAVAADGTAWVWDWRAGTVEAQRQVLTEVGIEVQFDGEGSRLLVAGNPAVVAWDRASSAGEEPTTLASGALYQALAVSPDGSSFATAGGPVLEIWSTSGEFQQQMVGHSGSVLDVAYSRDGEHLVTAGADGTARIWTADGDPVRTLEGHHGELWSAEFDDSGEWVVTGGDDGFIGVWEVATGHRIGWFPRHTDTVNSVRFTAGDHPRILSTSDDSTVRLSTCETCAPLGELRSRATRLLAADQRAAPDLPAVGACLPHSADFHRAVDCDEEHGAEVFAVLTHPGAADAPFPSDAAQWAAETCKGDAYRDYRGVGYLDDPDFLATAWGPDTSAEWELGQRTFVCVLYPLGSETTTGSARHTT
jgi:WD40 repeat protein